MQQVISSSASTFQLLQEVQCWCTFNWNRLDMLCALKLFETCTPTTWMWLLWQLLHHWVSPTAEVLQDRADELSIYSSLFTI